MNKQEILSNYKKAEDKMLLAQILDKIEFSKNKQTVENSDFLDMYQISIVKNFLKKIQFENYILYGGFEDSERKILIIYPEKYTLDMVEKNYNKILQIIRIELGKEEIGKYSHRNYLGAIVKVGIDRAKIGDIIVLDEGADIIVKKETLQILINELKGLTRFENSKFETANIEDLRKQQIKVEEISIIVPSLRLDNFVSDLSKTSRSKAVQIIDNERVFINGQNEKKPSKQIKMGDILTIRGKGRFIIKEISGTTRSGRSVVKIEKYV